jgi:tetratricopeptide (TPR) repeat protein
MSEIISMNAGMTTGNGSVRSSSPIASCSNNSSNTDSPQQLNQHHHHHQKQQQQRQTKEVTSELSDLNENTWFSIGKYKEVYFIYIFIIGNLSNSMDEWDKALVAYESALRHNPSSPKTLHALARLLLEREQFGPAFEVFQRLITLGKNGNREEILAEMALCWIGMEDLSKAAAFIQKAVQIGKEESGEGANNSNATTTPSPGGDDAIISTVSNDSPTITNTGTSSHCPTLWYALGIYHNRLGNEEAALDAFLAFIESERATGTEFTSNEISDRSREVYYRLGLIYRLTGKLKEARECFDFVRRQLTFCVRPSQTAQNQIYGPCHIEVLMQLALIDEAEGDMKKARVTLEKLLMEATSSGPMTNLFRTRNLIPKLRQKLGCLALSQSTIFENDSAALALLLKATEEDPQDALNWYYLGRLYLQLRQPTKAYDAYQQAVYRDGRNAAFWNSIGLLYFNIGQFRDALDAFTRAVHHAPHGTILWWNLGLLYESCHGIGSEDAKEAFQKGLEYARSKNDQILLSKFEFKLSEENNNKAVNSEQFSIMEMDANRFVIRVMAAFPRPQSAASMSRFLTYRGQQAAQAVASQLRRPNHLQQAGGPHGQQGYQYRPMAIPGAGHTGYPPQMRPNGNGIAGGTMRPIYGASNPHGHSGGHAHYR